MVRKPISLVDQRVGSEIMRSYATMWQPKGNYDFGTIEQHVAID